MDFHLATSSFSLDLLSEQTDEFFCANLKSETEKLIDLKNKVSLFALDVLSLSQEMESFNSEIEDIELAPQFKGYEADVESEEEKSKSANKLRPKKRVRASNSCLTPSHLDKLVYETLKEGFKKIKQMKQVRFFLNHHSDTRYADYVFRLGLEGSS